MKCEVTVKMIVEVDDWEKLPSRAGIGLSVDSYFSVAEKILSDIYGVRAYKLVTVTGGVRSEASASDMSWLKYKVLKHCEIGWVFNITDWSWIDRVRRDLIDVGAIVGRGNEYTLTGAGYDLLKEMSDDV